MRAIGLFICDFNKKDDFGMIFGGPLFLEKQHLQDLEVTRFLPSLDVLSVFGICTQDPTADEEKFLKDGETGLG